MNSIYREHRADVEGLAFLSGVNKQPLKRHPPRSGEREIAICHVSRAETLGFWTARGQKSKSGWAIRDFVRVFLPQPIVEQVQFSARSLVIVPSPCG